MERILLSFYKRYQKAWDEQDISAMLDLYHPDYKRVFHAKGIEQGLDDLEPIMSRWLIGTKRNKRRCLYENEDIVDEHFVANFQDGTTEAVLTVHLLKDGLLWRTLKQDLHLSQKVGLTHKNILLTTPLGLTLP